jgi:hypothetical protein
VRDFRGTLHKLHTADGAFRYANPHGAAFDAPSII